MRAQSGISLFELLLALVITVVSVTLLTAYTVGNSANNRVMSGLLSVEPLKDQIEKIRLKSGKFPDSDHSAGLKQPFSSIYVKSAKVQLGGSIVVKFRRGATNLHYGGDTIELDPEYRDGKITWHCVNGTVDLTYRPHHCK